MKAFLLVNIPEYLGVDDVKIKYELFDGVESKQIYGNYNLNDLKPLPQKKNTDMYSDLYGFGWNDCLDEILGGNNQ